MKAFFVDGKTQPGILGAARAQNSTDDSSSIVARGLLAARAN